VKKYKPKPTLKIFSAYWWNPIFWIVVFVIPISLFVTIAKNIWVYYSEAFSGLFKEWDLK
jgi:hypothetical protein